MIRVLVTGGRDYDDLASVVAALDEIHAQYNDLTVIQGGATGADSYAAYWANKTNGVFLVTERAEWDKHGKEAGPIRNQRMVDVHRPDLVLAFEGGRGTDDMVQRASAAGISVRFVPRLRPKAVSGEEFLD